MRTLDETDFTILRLLTENARRPYSEIAEHVDMSSPSVSERISRLQDLGVIRRFTVDLDRSKLSGGVPVLVDLSVRPAAIERVRTSLSEADSVEHVFTTAEARILFQGRIPDGTVRTFLTETIELEDITEYDVILLTDVDWTPHTGGTELALTCAQCGNTVDEDGETVILDEERYYLCCPSCKQQFEQQYERLRADAVD